MRPRPSARTASSRCRSSATRSSRAHSGARPRRWCASSSRPTSTSGTAACAISTGPRRSSSALAARFTLAVVSNTNDHELVPRQLERHGRARALRARRTPRSSSARASRRRDLRARVSELGAEPERCVYVGDTYGADYRGATRRGPPRLPDRPGAAAPIPEEHRLGFAPRPRGAHPCPLTPAPDAVSAETCATRSRRPALLALRVPLHRLPDGERCELHAHARRRDGGHRRHRRDAPRRTTARSLRAAPRRSTAARAA